MTTKVKHRARKVHPDIVALADEIGLPLFRRNKELWLNGDLQLTYRKQTKDGVVRDCTDEDNVRIACSILQQVIDARKTWGTTGQRWRRILQGLRDTVPNYRSMTYTYYREPSLDCGWMFRSQFKPHWEMAIELVGDKQVRVSGDTTDECLDKLADCYVE